MTSTTASPVNISLTVISALVSVPVLSVQMTLVEPSVSTPISFLMRAFSLAMRCTPMARATDRVAGRPSGTSATMTPSANSSAGTAPNLKISSAAKNRAMPQMTAMIETVRAIVSISRCNGDFSSDTPLVSVKMWPNSVLSPVAKTTAWPVPEATLVPMNTRLGMLMVASSSSTMGSEVLRTASDSPVRAMLMVDISYWRMSRASAEMLSPSSSCTRSPGTRSATATIVTSPSRTTLALAGTIFCRASVAFSARYSWKKPMVAFNSTTPRMAMVTLMLSWRAEPCDRRAAKTHRRAATSSMMANSVVNWSKKRKMIGRPTLAGSVLGP